MRIYSVLPKYAVLQKYLDNIFFVLIYSQYGVKGKKIINVPPCDNITLSIYNNVSIWQEEDTIYIKQGEEGGTSHQLILAHNNGKPYEKVYIGNIEEIAIVLKKSFLTDRFVKIEETHTEFASKVSFYRNSQKILNTLFNIKGYKNRQPFIETVLLEQLRLSYE